MNRYMFVVGKPGSDKAKTRRVYLKDGRKFVGYVFLPDGIAGQYAWRLPWMDHMAKGRHKTIKLACLAMGAKL